MRLIHTQTHRCRMVLPRKAGHNWHLARTLPCWRPIDSAFVPVLRLIRDWQPAIRASEPELAGSGGKTRNQDRRRSRSRGVIIVLARFARNIIDCLLLSGLGKELVVLFPPPLLPGEDISPCFGSPLAEWAEPAAYQLPAEPALRGRPLKLCANRRWKGQAGRLS